MLDIFEQVRDLQEVKSRINNFCKTIMNIYNKYSDEKVDMDEEIYSLKICRASEERISVTYVFLRDFGHFVLNDPNDEGDREWQEDLRTVEKTIYFPEKIFLGLIQPETYSSEYVEEELKKFINRENEKNKKQKESKEFIESFKAFTLSSDCDVSVEEQFHTMLVAFMIDVGKCFSVNKWFVNKYFETKEYSKHVQNTVRTVLKHYYSDKEQSLISGVFSDLKNEISVVLQLWDKSIDNYFYKLDNVAEDIYDFNYCSHMNSKKYRAIAKNEVENIIEELYKAEYINFRPITSDSGFNEYMLKYIAMYQTVSTTILKNGILKDLIVDFDSNNTLYNLYVICEKILMLEVDAITHKDSIKEEDYCIIDSLSKVAKDLIVLACQLTKDMERKKLEFYDIDDGFGRNLFEILRENFKDYDI